MAVQLPSQTARLGSRSFIIHEKGSRHYWQGVGCLSIKTFSGGRVFYEAGNGRYAVDESSFLRTFKQIFHLTPHQYLTQLRLEQARKLLTRSDLPVTDICFSVGFESPGSFSWLFRRRVGCSPEAFRRQKR